MNLSSLVNKSMFTGSKYTALNLGILEENLNLKLAKDFSMIKLKHFKILVCRRA